MVTFHVFFLLPDKDIKRLPMKPGYVEIPTNAFSYDRRDTRSMLLKWTVTAPAQEVISVSCVDIDLAIDMNTTSSSFLGFDWLKSYSTRKRSYIECEEYVTVYDDETVVYHNIRSCFNSFTTASGNLTIVYHGCVRTQLPTGKGINISYAFKGE